MKKFFFVALISIFNFESSICQAQQPYWVFLVDKAGTTFDPYTYFDAKAIERYRQCGADLYDFTNYPVNAAYEQAVAALATGEIGASRWMNAIGVMANPDQIAAIAQLPCVLRVQPIEGNGMLLTGSSPKLGEVSQSDGGVCPDPLDGLFDIAHVDGPLEAQLVRMGGQHFREAGIDGRGIRIAVFDGGFPQVNTHAAFKHLRDNHQIIKTWNFPKDKEDVYGWNSHGTMTLSCIAGRYYNGEDTVDLGLATGAEFLLARTEVNTEPFKEEVWWQMAVEWADRNGANIISSSLGYGKERHYTRDMDGTSYVARAGNLAARKGMLVVNSAGNEADDSQWKTIITPSDADSVLCVGGIENSLTEYNHIEFSSYGPSADGRLKPNVCAFGYARTANTGKDTAYHYVHGTSFSCPLVAGFAACAWQLSPGKTAMDLFHEIERSADLYPYYDYAFGYGVPQAYHFLRPGIETLAPTVRFVEEEDAVKVYPTFTSVRKNFFYHYRRPDGQLDYYGNHRITYMDNTMCFVFPKQSIVDHTLVVHLNGYTAAYTLSDEDNNRLRTRRQCFGRPRVEGEEAVADFNLGHSGDYAFRTSQWGNNNTWRWNLYFGFGLPVKTDGNELSSNVWSPSWNWGVRILRAFSKVYCLGVGIGHENSHYRFNDASVNALESTYPLITTTLGTMGDIDVRSLTFNEWTLELFQRVRLKSLGLFSNGLQWDLGVYGSLGTTHYELEGDAPAGAGMDDLELHFGGLDALDDYTLNVGVTTRLTYDIIGLYARYRLNGLGKDPASGKVLLPRLTLGLQLQL